MTRQLRKRTTGIVGWLAMLVAAVPGWARAADVDVQPLRLEVPVFRQVTTHIHRPADLKPGEKRPGVLLVGEPGCKLAAALAARQRLGVGALVGALGSELE